MDMDACFHASALLRCCNPMATRESSQGVPQFTHVLIMLIFSKKSHELSQPMQLHETHASGFCMCCWTDHGMAPLDVLMRPEWPCHVPGMRRVIDVSITIYIYMYVYTYIYAYIEIYR